MCTFYELCFSWHMLFHFIVRNWRALISPAAASLCTKVSLYVTCHVTHSGIFAGLLAMARVFLITWNDSILGMTQYLE